MVWPTNNKQEFCHGLKKEHRLLWLIDDIRFQYPFENHFINFIYIHEKSAFYFLLNHFRSTINFFHCLPCDLEIIEEIILVSSLSLSQTNFPSLKQVPTQHVTMSMTSSCPAKHLVNICKFCKWKKEWETVLLTRPIWGHN